MSPPKRAVVVGAGPNGLAAAITLAQGGWRVTVLEAGEQIGGGCRTAELTLPGYGHDVCSAIHPMAVLSPFFRALPLAANGLEWIEPPLALAHPFDDGSAALVYRSLERTAEGLGADGLAWRRLIGATARAWDQIAPWVLGPPRWPPGNPPAVLKFGLRAWRPAAALAGAFATARARGLWAGLAAHSMLPLEARPSAAYGLVLGAGAHLTGWPLPRGGSQAITRALAAHFRALGGTVQTGVRVQDGREAAQADAVVATIAPRQLAEWTTLPERERRRLRQYRLGPGVCKVDWALAGPIPWTARECAQAGTVHLGGTWEEIAAAERAPWHGQAAPRPFVLLTQPTQFDPSRAPAGGHIAWAYCHMPNGSAQDASAAIEAQIERFAPGFQRLVLARHVLTAAELEQYNGSLAGGDIGGGAQDLASWTRRFWHGYRTASPKIFLGSAAAPPGAGVHGLCGHFAARAALRGG